MQKVKFVYGDRQIFTNYTIGSFMDKGSNKVYESVNKNDKDDVQCIKEVILIDRNAQGTFQRQVKLLEFLNKHPHEGIIEFKGSYVIEQELSQFNTCRKGFIQMEKGVTSLEHIINERAKTGQQFSEREVIDFITSMIDAHRHLQTLEVAHRDVKPQNIIVFEMNPLRCKVCDVGVGTAVGIDNTRTRSLIGTVSYLSPELYKAYKEGKVTTNYNPLKSDVYSLGLVALYFCSLKKLFGKDRVQNESQYILTEIKAIKKHYKGIHGLSKTLKTMLKFEEHQRPEFIQLWQKIHENNWLKLKFDPYRTTGMMNFMATSVPALEGQTTIQRPEELPMIRMFIQDPSQLHDLHIKLPNLNKKDAQYKEIMEELRHMRYLELKRLSVDLELNHIEEEVIRGLCEGIEKNITMVELELKLWNNRLREKGFALIMDIFKRLTGLKKLSLILSANGITDGNLFEEKVRNLGNLSNLEELTLDLGINRLTSGSMPALLDALSQLTKLKKFKLNLQSNKITPSSLKPLPHRLQKLIDITDLSINLSGNDVANDGMYALGDMIAILPNLTSFDLVLWSSQITNKGLNEFMKSASSRANNLKQLRLVLWNNKLTETSMESVAERLSNFSHLEKIYINLSNNKIGDAGIKVLAKAMIELPHLKEIKIGLDATNITQPGCRYIARLLAVGKNVQKLDLSLRANNIGAVGLDNIAAGLKDMRKLTQLSLVLEGCQVTDDAIRTLISVLPRLHHLKTLYLNLVDCKLFDDMIYTLIHTAKSQIGNLKEISIDLRKNELSPVMRNRILEEAGLDKRLEIKLD